jgi:hypothetical protein
MSVYVSYTDETQASDVQEAFLIAGFAANESEWPKFSQEWNAILLRSPAIPYIHVTQLYSKAWQEEHRITAYQCDMKLQAAIDLLASYAGAIKQHLSQVSGKTYRICNARLSDAGFQIQRNHGFIDYLAFVGYSLGVLNHINAERPDVEKVTFAISKKKIVSHHIVNNLRDEMIENIASVKPDLAKKYGDILPLSMEDHMPLQAADVLCWHLQRSLAETKDERPKVLENIKVLQGMGFDGIDFTDKMMEKMTDRLIETSKPNDSD